MFPTNYAAKQMPVTFPVITKDKKKHKILRISVCGHLLTLYLNITKKKKKTIVKKWEN